MLRYYAAFNRGDWTGMLDCLDDEVVHDLNQGSFDKLRTGWAAARERTALQLA